MISQRNTLEFQEYTVKVLHTQRCYYIKLNVLINYNPNIDVYDDFMMEYIYMHFSLMYETARNHIYEVMEKDSSIVLIKDEFFTIIIFVCGPNDEHFG